LWGVCNFVVDWKKKVVRGKAKDGWPGVQSSLGKERKGSQY